MVMVAMVGGYVVGIVGGHGGLDMGNVVGDGWLVL